MMATDTGTRNTTTGTAAIIIIPATDTVTQGMESAVRKK